MTGLLPVARGRAEAAARTASMMDHSSCLPGSWMRRAQVSLGTRSRCSMPTRYTWYSGMVCTASFPCAPDRGGHSLPDVCAAGRAPSLRLAGKVGYQVRGHATVAPGAVGAAANLFGSCGGNLHADDDSGRGRSIHRHQRLLRWGRDPRPAGHRGRRETGLDGTVRIGPIQPVCHENEPCDAPLQARFTLQQHGRVVARFASDSAGRFLVYTAPGSYLVVPRSADRYRCAGSGSDGENLGTHVAAHV